KRLNSGSETGGRFVPWLAIATHVIQVFGHGICRRRDHFRRPRALWVATARRARDRRALAHGKPFPRPRASHPAVQRRPFSPDILSLAEERGRLSRRRGRPILRRQRNRLVPCLAWIGRQTRRRDRGGLGED